MLDRDGEVRQPAVALDFAEAALGFEHAGGGPAQAHVAELPVLDVAVYDPDGGDHRLARIGRLEGELSVPVIPRRVTVKVSSMPSLERGGGAGVGVVEALDCEGVELLERAVVVGLLPRSA